MTENIDDRNEMLMSASVLAITSSCPHKAGSVRGAAGAHAQALMYGCVTELKHGLLPVWEAALRPAITGNPTAFLRH